MVMGGMENHHEPPKNVSNQLDRVVTVSEPLEFGNSSTETFGEEVGGQASCGWLWAFPGTGCFLKAFRAPVSGIPTMVWVLIEGQGRDGIPHPEPRKQAAAELLRNRRHCCPFGRRHPAAGPGPLEGGSGWLGVREHCLWVRRQL